MSATEPPHTPLDFEQVHLRLLAAGLPEGVRTPIVRWRLLLRVSTPPPLQRADGSSWRPVSVRSFRAVGQVLADYANRDGGSCRPGVETIAAGAGVSIRTAQYALAALETRGLIRRDSRGGKRDGGGGRATRYELVCPVNKRVNRAVESAAKGASNDSEGCNGLHPRSATRGPRKNARAQEEQEPLGISVFEGLLLPELRTIPT